MTQSIRVLGKQKKKAESSSQFMFHCSLALQLRGGTFVATSCSSGSGGGEDNVPRRARYGPWRPATTLGFWVA
jgi:hypothetical protein